jgi:hypothetical protein
LLNQEQFPPEYSTAGNRRRLGCRIMPFRPRFPPLDTRQTRFPANAVVCLSDGGIVNDDGGTTSRRINTAAKAAK